MEKRDSCSLCDAPIRKRWPWWAAPPKDAGIDVLTLEWGFVLLCEKNHFDWEPVRPSNDEIIHRKTCFIPGLL